MPDRKPPSRGPTAGRDALRRLAETYAPALFGYCARRLRDRHLAEDAVQEVFYRAARAQTTGQVTDMAAWLFGAARRCCQELARKRHKRPVRLADPDSMPAEGRPDAAADELSEQLDTALARLDDSQRALIYMKHTQGLTCREIAHRTAEPVGTVTSRLARAYARLRRALQRQEA